MKTNTRGYLKIKISLFYKFQAKLFCKTFTDMATTQSSIVGDFIEDLGKVLTPEMVERLRCVLTEDLGLSKKDADNLIMYIRNIRRKRLCLKRNKIIKIGPRNQWIKELSRSIANQIAMFVVGMLFSNRNSRSKRITEKVLEHLCELTGENSTVEFSKTCFERSLIVVADRMATWIDEIITDTEIKYEEKYKTAESLEGLKESLITFKSSVTGSVESETSVWSEEISETEESKLESKISTPHQFSESDENETKESELEDYSEEDEEMESREEEEDKSEEEKLENRDQSEYDETDEEEEERVDNDDGESVDVTESESEDRSVVNTTEEESDEREKIEFNEKEEDEENTDEVMSDEGTTSEENPDEGKTDDELADEEEVGEMEDVEEEVGKENEEEYGKEDIIEKLEDNEIEEIDNNMIERKSVVTKTTVPEIGIKEIKVKQPLDPLDFLKEDVVRITKADKKSNRQKAMREVIDKRLEQIAREKQSLNSIVKYDILETASIVATWVENILSSADAIPVENLKTQGNAFEIKREKENLFQVNQVSSTTVAQKVAEVRGLEPPPRKTKLPRTMSPMNLTSSKNWVNWTLDAVNFSDEWGKWLDETLADFDTHLFMHRPSISHQDRYDFWKEFKNQRGFEATKWRVMDKKIKEEGSLWSRKLKY